ncbi:MAG: hypothetical protein HY280_10935 [Nitrospinae bacterium]|nr:hypothetical protein [Nitrospinota bacterium]
MLNIVDNVVEMSPTSSCSQCKQVQVVDKLRTLAGGEKTEAVSAPEVKTPAEKEQPAKGVSSANKEHDVWDSVKDSSNPDDFQAYLDDYPKGTFAKLAKSRMATLKKPKEQATKLPPLPPKETAGGDSSNKEVAVWNSVKESTNPEDIEVYLQAYPKGVFVQMARRRIEAIKKAVSDKEAADKAVANKKAEDARNPSRTMATAQYWTKRAAWCGRRMTEENGIGMMP